MVTENQNPGHPDEQKPVQTIQLEHPFEFGSETISELNILRRPKKKDMKGIKGLDSDETALLLGRVSDLSTPQIEEMDLDDFALCSEALANLLPNSQRIGKGLSL